MFSETSLESDTSLEDIEHVQLDGRPAQTSVFEILPDFGLSSELQQYHGEMARNAKESEKTRFSFASNVRESRQCLS